MAAANKTPPVHSGGAPCELLAGPSRFPSNLDAYRAQILVAAYHVRPEVAAMLVAFAFGGGLA